MRVLVSGSTGLIGSMLFENLEASGHEVVRLLRPQSPGAAQGILWDPATGSLDRREIEGFDAVVHLAGENIANRRWSADQMARIRDSRIGGTRLLAETLASLESPPSVFACASAGGYYGNRGSEVLSEDARPGGGFMANSTKEWEDAAAAAAAAGVRVVNLRIGVVLTAAGGMLARVLPFFRLGLGGRLGSGSQFMSWLTRSDAIDAIVWTLEHDDLSGPFNVSSPNPVYQLGVHAGAEQGARSSRVLCGARTGAQDSPGRPGGGRDIQCQDGSLPPPRERLRVQNTRKSRAP